MLFSVIIPTFNRRDSLQVSLEGLTRQEFPPDRFEVVVVSDGSTDGTDELLSNLAENGTYPFALRPIRQENAGPARARNRGIDEARGEIIVFLDDDVEPAPTFLSSHAAHHLQNPQIAVIGPMSPDPARRWSEPCWIAWEHAMLEKQYTNWRTGVWPGVGPNHFYTGNASVARRHVQAVGGFDETFKRQEDVEMADRMSRNDPPVAFAFDSNAKGTHRPLRTFTSWCAVPTAYGQLDAIRVRRSNLSLQGIQDLYQGRNRVTRACIGLCLSVPRITPLLEFTLASLARIVWRLRVAKIALALLSTVYNIRYIAAFSRESGVGHRELSIPR
ncbi:MAG: glycosyltransferase [Armatimonadota bacterium]